MGGCLSNWNINNNISVDDGNKNQKKTKKDYDSSKARDEYDDIVNVITGNGDLKHYTVPVTASQVLLHSETTSSSSSSSSSSSNDWFLCNSDSLYYDEYIQALDLEKELEGGAGQIYFLLPTAKLQYPLTASDMAALAVKASLALQHTSSSSSSSSSDHQHRQRKIRHHKHQQQQRNIGSKKNINKARISPFLLGDDDVHDHEQQNQRTLPSSSSSMMMRKQQTLSRKSSNDLGVSKSMRKLQRYSSSRAKLAVRSFRLTLTTIYEGSVLQFYS